MGLVGYLSLGIENSSSTDLIIYRFKIGNSDYFMSIGKTLLVIALLVNGGINALPLKMLAVEILDL